MKNPLKVLFDRAFAARSIGPAPCFVCSGLPDMVQHTACESVYCDRVICDNCRFTEGNWVWVPGDDDRETTEMCAACYMCRVKNGI